jgi:hypothetical protein
VPFHLHGVLNKACGRETLQEQLFQLLEQQLAPINEPASRKVLYGHRLSSIEQTILRYMPAAIVRDSGSAGPEYQNHSCPQVQCDARLGISSALGLLSAADIRPSPAPCGEMLRRQG